MPPTEAAKPPPPVYNSPDPGEDKNPNPTFDDEPLAAYTPELLHFSTCVPLHVTPTEPDTGLYRPDVKSVPIASEGALALPLGMSIFPSNVVCPNVDS